MDKLSLQSFALILFPLALLASLLAPAPLPHQGPVSVAVSVNETHYS